MWGYVIGGATVFAFIVGLFSIYNGRVTRKMILEGEKRTREILKGISEGQRRSQEILKGISEGQRRSQKILRTLSEQHVMMIKLLGPRTKKKSRR